MIKLAIKILVFSVLFFIGLTFMDEQFKERRISYLDREIYKELNTNVDIAIFGSSHGMNGVDPRILEKELNKTTYNFSSAGQRLVSTMAVIDEVLSDHDVELAIVDIFPGTISSIRRTETRTRAFQYNTFDNLDFSISKMIAHTRVNGIEELHNMSPTVRRHHHWPAVLRGVETSYDLNADFSNGFFSRFNFDQRMWDNKIADINKIEDKDVPVSGLTRGEKKNIKDIVKRFKRKGISLLFVSVPYYQDTLGLRAISQQKHITEYLNEIEVPYIEFNTLWDDLALSQDEFTDAGHTNTKAALKLSEYLVTYIKNNYPLKTGQFSTEKMSQNRYAIIDNDGHGASMVLKADSTHLLYTKGYKQLYGFRPYIGKFEILLEAIQGDIQPIDLRYEYQVNLEEKDQLSQRIQNFTDENGLVAQRVKVRNSVNYKGKTYAVFQFETPFDRLKEFSIYLFDQKSRIEIFTVDTLVINSD